MSSLLETLVGRYASLFCMSERRGSPQMSAKVHAPLERMPAPLHKKPTKQSINDRLRALIGDMISEKELEQRLSFGRVLGAGATSKVYEAVDKSSGLRVSVKVFDKVSMVEARRSMVADGQYVREKAVHRVRRRLLKLVSELEISKTLDHPNIINPEILFLHASAEAAREGFRGGPADVWSVGVLIFALLTGCAPFDDSDFHRLRRDVSRNRINYPAYISDQAKGLLKNVLVTDPLMRPTATDLLSYGWFQDSPELDSLSNNQEEDWLCTKRKSELNDDIRCRSLSCRRTTDSDGTYSSSASLEDVSKRKLSSPTHFSSLEEEASEGTT
ncbi:hypothetical protein C6341_g2629 [Phytophthora cactorum]|nr:hypothetical protein PC120_g1987 [Phytophthora cactorum]KAG3188672.1 hypothetical protein C6341_g2629 [Phytophthora cactorum]